MAEAKKQPEERYTVTYDGGRFTATYPDETSASMMFGDITRVVIETNDTGPWGIDVWWILYGRGPDDLLAFPLGGNGYREAAEVLERLPGFQLRGMNSVERKRFECWPDPSAEPERY
jgi:hypothetical protein